MSRTVSIWRWQSSFAGTLAVIVAVLAVFEPQVVSTPSLLFMAVALAAFTTLLTFVVPWARFPRDVVVILPFLDILSVGLSTSVPDLWFGLLWMFPVTWLATHFAMPWVVSGIVSACVFLILFAHRDGEQAEFVLRLLMILLTLGVLGIGMRVWSQRARLTRRQLERQAQQVKRAAERARTNQQRVTQVIDALGVAVVVVMEDGRVLQTNDAYRALYGWDGSGSDAPSTVVEHDRRGGSAVALEKTILARAAAGEHLHDERVWLLDIHGRWRALQVSTQTMATASEGQRVSLVVIDDITEMREAMEERRVLAAVVSHEVRNPLTVVIGHIDLLRERDDLPADVMAQLEIIANAGERMEDLFASALEATGRAPQEPFGPVDLRDLIEASAASYAPLITAGRQHLQVRGAANPVIYGDAWRLRQVVDNLLSNAVKYTPAGGSIIVGIDTADDGKVEITVSDTGLGIPSQELPHLFEPYFRTDGAVSSGIQGTGLGLGIARDIVEAHEGCICIASSPGEGTVVTMCFPPRRVKSALA